MKKIISLFLVLGSFSATAQTPTTVSGVVWVDQAPVNGVRDVNEPVLPGILVELYDAATDEVASSAISALDGSFALNTSGGTYYVKYVFPTDGFEYADFRSGSDNSLNSAADPGTEQSEIFTVVSGTDTPSYGLGLKAIKDTRTFCDGKELTVTNWNKTFTLPKSDLDVTKLTNIKLFTAAAVHHPTMGIENTNATDIDVTVEYKGRVTLTVPNTNGVNTTSYITESMLSKELALSAYDGVSDYAGGSGRTFTNEFASASGLRTYSSAASKNLFTGTDNISFPGTTTSVSSIIGAANIQFVVSTYAAAGVCVVYTYQSGALPVTLTSLSAKANSEGKHSTVDVSWSTTAETNSEKFEIEKSADAKNWQLAGTKAAAQNSDVLNKYSFTDLSPLAGKSYYRLKMVDLDGSFAYSKIVGVELEGSNIQMTLFPNPVAQQLFVQEAGQQTVKEVIIFNNAGKVVSYNNTVATEQGIDVSNFLTGTYLVRVKSNNGSYATHRVVIAR
ncbi:MAG TPA: choice-of-anchor E domain-containing protein [Dyadobacter sp.]|jgi:hypothetical protein|nr:choice-of-anchor E domain-containing protein [Dyadobacter sp.]